jgi:hypothetical protein
VNLCNNQTHFQYYLDPIFDNATLFAETLAKSQASFRIIHKLAELPDLNVTIRVFDEGIMNVRWTWPDGGAKGKR